MPSPAHDPAFAHEFPALAEALVGQYHVRRELGRGGMGVVYLAQDERLDRLVALKVLPPALAAGADTRERFLREARTAARLAHPNVVPVHRADEAGGTAFFAMSFVDGESLGDRVRDRGPLPPAEAVPILRDVAWALAYAHARGVVHRDVKPENILLERPTRRTLVTDFGIAHHTMTEESARLTQDGHVLGTVHYMSPEQVTGQALDGRSDLYALGVVAYQALGGRLPFEGLATPAVLVAHATRPGAAAAHGRAVGAGGARRRGRPLPGQGARRPLRHRRGARRRARRGPRGDARRATDGDRPRRRPGPPGRAAGAARRGAGRGDLAPRRPTPGRRAAPPGGARGRARARRRRATPSTTAATPPTPRRAASASRTWRRRPRRPASRASTWRWRSPSCRAARCPPRPPRPWG
jgi:predicted Ser/Thr protein kinase